MNNTELHLLFNALEKKVEKTRLENLKLKKENQEIRDILQIQLKTNKEKDIEIKKLKELLNEVNIAKEISNFGDNSEMKVRIRQLINEIDACLALLGGEM